MHDREHSPNYRSCIRWRKSSYSGGSNGDCVEVADGYDAQVPIRDSKYPTGSALLVPMERWAGFISAIRSGRLD